MSPLDLKPYEVVSEDGQLTITIRKDFDFASLHQNWAHAILALNPGPFQFVRIDMGICGLVNSTFFAGLMQLHCHYTRTGSRPLLLLKPDPRVVRNLGIMKMQSLFGIEER
jgi:hypothetical protein